MSNGEDMSIAEKNMDIADENVDIFIEDADIVDEDTDIKNDNYCDRKPKKLKSIQYYNKAQKREHHNVSERKRRNRIKENFTKLWKSIPTMQAQSTASRVDILKGAAKYIQDMRTKNFNNRQKISTLARQNKLLLDQIMHFDPEQ